MNIGQAARASGVSAKMIRYYESIGLVPPARRTKGNYRNYGTADIERLSFIRRAIDLGFPPARVRELLVLWSSGARTNASAKSLALACIAELEARSVDLKRMIKTLRGLARS